MRHEAEIKSNAYWLGLLAHLQAVSVPRKVILFSLQFLQFNFLLSYDNSLIKYIFMSFLMAVDFRIYHALKISLHFMKLPLSRTYTLRMNS